MTASEAKAIEKEPAPKCDCHLHEYQVCDICQGVTGNEVDVEPAQVESAPVELYYVQDTRQYCGNSCFWWKPNGNGYTCNLDEAWKVPKEKAESMMRHRPGVDVAWPVASIDSGTARHFDMQNLREMKYL